MNLLRGTKKGLSPLGGAPSPEGPAGSAQAPSGFRTPCGRWARRSGTLKRRADS